MIVGPAFLFVGCRDLNSDCLYKQELLRLMSQGHLDELRVVCSRGHPPGTHLFKENRGEIWSSFVDAPAGKRMHVQVRIHRLIVAPSHTGCA